MIFIKFFRDAGFWIVWSIAIMKRTVLDDEWFSFYLVAIFWTTRMSSHVCNEMKVVLPSRQIRTQLGKILSAEAFFINPSFSEILKVQIF